MDEVRLRFCKKERLQKRRQFLGIYERGDRVHAPHFVLYISKNNLAHHRLGITVSRKVGKPVVRNRVKRRVREIFRKNKGVLSPHCDLVVNAKRSAADCSYEKLRADFVAAIGKWRHKEGRS